jgi:hypothetical protein
MVCVCQQQQQQQQWCYPVAAPLLAQKLNATDPPRPTDNTLLYIFPDAIASCKLKYTLSLKHTHAAPPAGCLIMLCHLSISQKTRVCLQLLCAPRSNSNKDQG